MTANGSPPADRWALERDAGDASPQAAATQMKIAAPPRESAKRGNAEGMVVKRLKKRP
jgi:hypothetical protein